MASIAAHRHVRKVLGEFRKSIESEINTGDEEPMEADRISEALDIDASVARRTLDFLCDQEYIRCPRHDQPFYKLTSKGLERLEELTNRRWDWVKRIMDRLVFIAVGALLTGYSHHLFGPARQVEVQPAYESGAQEQRYRKPEEAPILIGQREADPPDSTRIKSRHDSTPDAMHGSSPF